MKKLDGARETKIHNIINGQLHKLFFRIQSISNKNTKCIVHELRGSKLTASVISLRNANFSTANAPRGKAGRVRLEE
jgi:hypothetical protein